MENANNVTKCQIQTKEARGRGIDDDVTWPKPRVISINKHPRGFGFTLRHFVVYPPQPSTPRSQTQTRNEETIYQTGPSGSNDGDSLDTIFVKTVKDGGSASLAGLRTGDRILAINGEQLTGRSYPQAINLIQNSGDPLVVLVIPRDEDILQTLYPSSFHQQDAPLHSARVNLERINLKRAESRRQFFSDLHDEINSNNNSRSKKVLRFYDDLNFGDGDVANNSPYLTNNRGSSFFSPPSVYSAKKRCYSGSSVLPSALKNTTLYNSIQSLKSPPTSNDHMSNFGLHYSSPSQNELKNMERRSRLSQRSDARKAALAQYVEDANTFTSRPNDSYAISGQGRADKMTSSPTASKLGSDYKYSRSFTTSSLPFQGRYSDHKAGDWRSSRSVSSGSVGSNQPLSYKNSRSNKPTGSYTGSSRYDTTTPRSAVSFHYPTSMTSPAQYTPSAVRELSRYSAGQPHFQRTGSDDGSSRRKHINVSSPAAHSPREYTRPSSYSTSRSPVFSDSSTSVASPTQTLCQTTPNDASSPHPVTDHDQSEVYTLELDSVQSYTAEDSANKNTRTSELYCRRNTANRVQSPRSSNIPINVEHNSTEGTDSTTPLPLSDVSQNILNSQSESRFQSPKRNSGQFQTPDASNCQMYIVSPPEKDIKSAPFTPRENPSKIVPKAVVKPSDPSPFGTSFMHPPIRRTSSSTPSAFSDITRPSHANKYNRSNTTFVSPDKSDVAQDQARARKTLDFRQHRPLSDTNLKHKVSIEVSRDPQSDSVRPVSLAESSSYDNGGGGRIGISSSSAPSSVARKTSDQTATHSPRIGDDKSELTRVASLDFTVGNAPTVTQPSVLKQLPTGPLVERVPARTHATDNARRHHHHRHMTEPVTGQTGASFSQKPALSVPPRNSSSSKMIMYLSTVSSPISRSLTSLVSFKPSTDQSPGGVCPAQMPRSRHSICEGSSVTSPTSGSEEVSTIDSVAQPHHVYTSPATTAPPPPPPHVDLEQSMSLEMSPSRSSLVHYAPHNSAPVPPTFSAPVPPAFSAANACGVPVHSPAVAPSPIIVQSPAITPSPAIAPSPSVTPTAHRRAAEPLTQTMSASVIIPTIGVQATAPTNIVIQSQPNKPNIVIQSTPNLHAQPTLVIQTRPVISPLNRPESSPAAVCHDDSTQAYNGHPSASTNRQTATIQPVVLRKKLSDAEEELLKFHRRTSYLMATSKERTNLSPPREVAHISQEVNASSTVSFDVVETPAKDINKNKLKQFFGEKTPSIRAATDISHRHPKSPTPIPDINRESYLTCKVAISDGKRSSDRSWRVVWAMLRGHLLYMLKEKKDISVSTPLLVEEQPISIKSCMVDIANDYTKKKNVFRLRTYNGCEYLLQAEDAESMSAWIHVIQTNNDPDGDESGIVMSDLIARKTIQYDQTAPSSKTSPQTTQKHQKKSSILKAKMPYSPSLRRRKLHADDAKSKDSKDKDSKTWKGKLGKSFKLFGSSAVPVVEEEPAPCSGTFGVPLEHCQPSPENESVPLIVEICTKIVEIKGLEVVGIYRVPGNIAAVTGMMDELNNGVENMDSDNDKWFDLNVIGSLLKAFFRKLPEPLVTEALYESFIAANRIKDPIKRMLSLKRLLHELPEHHFETFSHIAVHLARVAAYEHKNKMDAKNLAIVFGPTLVRRKTEDACGMVADMSDQCRIIETVIKNHEWFFSSWDVDSYVPTPGADDSQHRMSVSSIPIEDEYDREVDTRTIVTSIIQAANRKVNKEKEKMSMSCDNLGGDAACSLNERDIDSEVAKRKTKSHETLHRESASNVDLSCSLPTGKSMEKLDSQITHVGDYSNKSYLTDSYQSLPSTPDWSVVNGRSFASDRSDAPTFGSSELLDENDELKISHGSGSSLSGRDTLARLKRIEEEARLLRVREEQRQQEREKRRTEQQRIEEELKRTREEIALDESQGIDDLIRQTQFVKQTSESAPRRATVADTGLSPGINDCDVVNINARSTYLVGDIINDGATDRVVNSILHVPQKQHTVVIMEHLGQRSNSLEAIGPGKSNCKDKLNKNSNNSLALPPNMHEIHNNRLSSRRNSRRSSLDSLRDFYDKDRRKSWASTDSEDGSDLLTSLTTTFDQKLQILLNPKYKLNGTRKNSRSDESFTSSSRTDTSSQDGDKSTARVVYKNHPPFSPDSAYRDPSLHRTYRPEAKIGIASRFERGSSTPVTPTCAQYLDSRIPNVKFVAPSKPDNKDGAARSGGQKSHRDLDKICKKSLKSCVKKSTRDTDNVTSGLRVYSREYDRSLRRGRRRHTVGGMNDVEHYKALVSVIQPAAPQRTSAWEQLQPAVAPDSVENTSLVHWLHNERLRMSQSNLATGASHLAERNKSMSSSCGDLNQSCADLNQTGDARGRNDH